MSVRKVAVVTGSNQGIGFAIVRGLCKQWEGDVFLTARDEARGQAAVEELEKEGLKPKFHLLDILDHGSIEKLRNFLSETYGGLDILVNNAGIAYKMSSTAPFSEQAEVTMNTNFWATLDVCDTLYPLLRPHSRVVNVSSMAAPGAISRMSDERKKEITTCKTLKGIQSLMRQFVRDAKSGDHTKRGWPNSAYGMTKVGITVMSNIHQRQFEDQNKEDVVVNSCCPGYVSTNMSSYKGHLTIDQGAETPLYCALLPPDIKEPRGKFLRDKKVAQWN